MTNSQKIKNLETKLNDFSMAIRGEALRELMSMVRGGDIELPPPADLANMHCHSFFSFNGCGHSPTSLAWLARRNGLKLMGVVDFDTLDAVDEFLTACESVGVRGAAGIESRVFVPEFSGLVINSPGEPGIAYHMGIGFTASRVPDPVSPILTSMRRQATKRNLEIIKRVNAHLAPVAIDYEQEVLPLTPSGNATERHILAAYLQKTGSLVNDPEAFWAAKLGMSSDRLAPVMGDRGRFQSLVRARLMKRGGVGYVQPGPETFPTIETFHELILACGALPCAAWLNGASPGEQAAEKLFEIHLGKGVEAVNIIPELALKADHKDRRRRQIQNLYELVELAEKLGLPLNVGTEMNVHGQKLTDDFDGTELAPLREAAMNGAFFVYGHTIAQRVMRKGCQSDWAKIHFSNRRERNAFYTNLGLKATPGPACARRVREIFQEVLN